MVSILLLVLECLKELFLVVVVGGFVAIASAGLIIYILTKLLGANHLKELMNLDASIYKRIKRMKYNYTLKNHMKKRKVGSGI